MSCTYIAVLLSTRNPSYPLDIEFSSVPLGRENALRLPVDHPSPVDSPVDRGIRYTHPLPFASAYIAVLLSTRNPSHPLDVVLIHSSTAMYAMTYSNVAIPKNALSPHHPASLSDSLPFHISKNKIMNEGGRVGGFALMEFLPFLVWMRRVSLGNVVQCFWQRFLDAKDSAYIAVLLCMRSNGRGCV